MTDQGQDSSALPSRPIIRRAPLVPVAVLLACGIAVGRYLPATLALWLTLALVGGIVSAIALRREHLHRITLGALGWAIFFAGASAGNVAYYRIANDHVATYCGNAQVYATLRGEIVTWPQWQVSPRPYQQPDSTLFLLDAQAIRRADGQFIPASGLAPVRVGERVENLRPGQRVELVATLAPIRGPGNPGQTDWRLADRYKGVLVRFSVPDGGGVVPLPPEPENFFERAWHSAYCLARQHVESCGPTEDSQLVEALVLGDRAPALQELNQAMMEAGTAHMLSISGQHLAIFLGFIYLVGRLVMLTPRRSAAVVLAILIVYVMLAEPNPPLTRSAIMAAAVCIAVISGRSVSTGNALAAAAIILLAIDPLELFQAGFQLSFGIVIGMVMLRRPLMELLFGRFLRRRALMVFRSDERWRQWLYFSGAWWGMDGICLGLSASLASAPLVAYHFGLFSPYAPLLSILLSPLMVLVLVPAYLSLALAWLMPNLSGWLGQAASVAAGWMHHICLWLRCLPGLSLDVFTVPAGLVGLCYAAVLLWLLARRWRWVVWPAAGSTIAAVAWLLASQLPAPAPAGGELHVLSVGHGSMTLFHAPDGKTYLFDAGSLNSERLYDRLLRPFLRERRLPSPISVFISHANLDHHNIVPDLVNRRPPARVYVNQSFEQYAGDPAAGTLIRQLAAKGVPVVRLRRGQTVALGQSAHVEVLWPPEADEAAPPPTSQKENVNDTSLVLRVVCGQHSVILPGDAEEVVQKYLAGLPAAQVHCDAMLLPHHGSIRDSLGPFLKAAGPSLVVQSSTARRDSPRMPALLGQAHRYCTFKNGWVMLDMSRDPIQVQTMRQ